MLTTPLVLLFSSHCGQGAASGVRVNSVVPGHVETPIYGEMPRDMLVGITGTTQLFGRPIESEEVRYVVDHRIRRLYLAAVMRVTWAQAGR